MFAADGKAQVQNGSYSDALSTFRKSCECIERRRLISETQIWLLRTYSAMGWFYDAEIFTLIFC
jgi:hypothetical protein